MEYRIIYDYNLSKLITQYNYIKNLFPKHSLYVYKNHKTGDLVECRHINIYIDTISEKMFFICPSNINILIVNEDYIVKNKYMRREEYSDKPLILLDNVIHYYFCLTLYSYNYLLHNGINKSKLLLLDGLIDIQHLNSNKLMNHLVNKHINNKQVNKQVNKQTYIFYEIDMYSFQNNIILLEVWLKYFINWNTKLIIKYVHEKESIICLFKQKLDLHKLEDDKIYYYKNIIVFKDKKYLKKYYKNIELVIVNNSNFNLLYKLYQYIIHEKYIITINNEITKELLDKLELINEFNEKNLYQLLNTYFQINNAKKTKIIKDNKKNLVLKSNESKKKLDTFFRTLRI